MHLDENKSDTQVAIVSSFYCGVLVSTSCCHSWPQGRCNSPPAAANDWGCRGKSKKEKLQPYSIEVARNPIFHKRIITVLVFL